MKLTAAQVQTVVDQVEAEPLSEQNPTVAQLEEAFGPNTFFINDDGLHIVEPSGKTDSGSYPAHFIKLASWNDEEKTTLAMHDAELAGTVKLDPEEDSDPAA